MVCRSGGAGDERQSRPKRDERIVDEGVGGEKEIISHWKTPCCELHIGSHHPSVKLDRFIKRLKSRDSMTLNRLGRMTNNNIPSTSQIRISETNKVNR